MNALPAEWTPQTEDLRPHLDGLNGLRINLCGVSVSVPPRARLLGGHGAKEHTKPYKLLDETGWKGEECERRRRAEEGRDGRRRGLGIFVI